MVSLRDLHYYCKTDKQLRSNLFMAAILTVCAIVLRKNGDGYIGVVEGLAAGAGWASVAVRLKVLREWRATSTSQEAKHVQQQEHDKHRA